MMTRYVRPAVLAMVALFVIDCGLHPRADHPERIDRTVLTREQMLDGHYSTVYDAVLALHPIWLRPRGPDSFVSPSQVWVYIDDGRAGDIEVLKNIQPSLVTTVRWYDGPQATSRWGVDHGAGVIHISTWGEGALGFPSSEPEAARTSAGRWIGTWEAALQLTEPRNMPPAPGLDASTLRQVVHLSVGGERLRVRIANTFGNGPVTIGAADIALSRGSDTIDVRSDRALSFRGRREVTLVPGAMVTSDPIDYSVPPLTNVALTLYVAAVPTALTGHPGSRTTSFIVPGNHIAEPSLDGAARTEHWYLIDGIDVERTRGAAVVVLGNSIADGRGSGTDRQDRWPDNLAARLQRNAPTADAAVLNAGIGGNCVLRECLGPSALSRLDRDVLDAPGVRWLIVSEGVNDIGGARTPEAATAVATALIDGFKRIIARAHDRGIRVYGATILPFGGSFYDSPEREAARRTVNDWIRSGGAFDAVLDLEAAMRDPEQPTHLRREVDSGDHLHPNELGYRVMADAIDLRLFTDFSEK